MSSLTRRLLQLARSPGEFFTQVSTLSAGTALSQLLLLVASPILTRLFSPKDFGKLGAFMGVIGVLAVFSTLRYHYALVKSEDDRELSKLSDLCLRVSLAATGLTFLGAAISETHAYLTQPSKLGWVTFLLPVAVLFAAWGAIFAGEANRTKQYKLIAIGGITQSVLSTSFNVGIGYLTGSWFVLVGGFLLGQLGQWTAIAWGLKRNRESGQASFFPFAFRHKLSELIAVAKIHKKFPIFDTWADLATSGSLQAIPLVIAYLFFDAATGAVLVAQRILALPMHFLGTAMGRVFYQHASDSHSDPERAGRLMHRMFLSSLLVGIIPITAVVMLGDDFFAFVFGERWRIAGVVAQCLAPAYLLQFASSPLSSIFWVDSSQERFLAFSVILLFVRLGSLIIPSVLGTPFLLTIYFHGVAMVTVWLLLSVMALKQRSIALQTILLQTAGLILTAIVLGGSLQLLVLS